MKIAIIGGGFTGLTAAYELTKKDHDVHLFEKEKTLGGLAWGFKQPNWDWYLEGGYHHWFTNDAAMFRLIRELGLGNKLIIKRPVTANYYKGRVYPFDSPANLLTFPFLNPIDKLRTAALLAFCKINPFWQPLEGMTAKDLFISVGGRSAWEVIWEPLMRGKFGDYADSVAASWLWARIKKRTPRLAYMEGGFHTVIKALERAITKNGGKIYVDQTIPAISHRNGKFLVSDDRFDAVLLTVPTPIARKLAPFVPPDYFRGSSTIPHLWAQTLIFETREPILENVYWLNVTDRSFPFLAAVAHTNFMDKRHYAGHHITYFGNYLPQGHPYLSMTKEQLLKKFLPFIKLLTLNSKLSILNSFLFVGPFAQPVHKLHYSLIAPKLLPAQAGETPIRGVYLANLDSIYPWDRGTNYAVELGIRAAEKIAQS